jgi:hypothetical protein
MLNAALSGAPEGHPFECLVLPQRSGGGNKLLYSFCISPKSYHTYFFLQNLWFSTVYHAFWNDSQKAG